LRGSGEARTPISDTASLTARARTVIDSHKGGVGGIKLTRETYDANRAKSIQHTGHIFAPGIARR